MLVLKQIVLFLTSPLCVSLVLLAASVCYLKLLKPQRATTFLTISLALLLVFSQSWVANLLLYPLEFSELEEQRNNAKPDIIFVPACYYHTEGNIPEITRWHECSIQRMLQAHQLHKELQIPIVLTGGNFLHDKSIFFASKAKMFMMTLGVDEENIIAIPSGYNTRSEVIALKARLPEKNILAISSATHRFRLSHLLSDFQYQHEVIGVDFHSSGELTPYLSKPSPNALYNTGRAVYEYLAIAKYFIYDSSIAVYNT